MSVVDDLLKIVVSPLQDHITRVATTHAEVVGERQVRALVEREARDVLIPRVAVAGGVAIAGLATAAYAFATRRRLPGRSRREVLEGLRNPMPAAVRRRITRRSRVRSKP